MILKGDANDYVAKGLSGASIIIKLQDESNLISEQNIELLENDLVVVRSKLGYQPKEFVSASGLVKKPGNYALKTNNYSVFDLIKDFEGFLPNAELNGIKLKRKVEVEVINDLIKNIDDTNNDETIDLDEFIEIGLNIDRIINENEIDEISEKLKITIDSVCNFWFDEFKYNLNFE